MWPNVNIFGICHLGASSFAWMAPLPIPFAESLNRIQNYRRIWLTFSHLQKAKYEAHLKFDWIASEPGFNHNPVECEKTRWLLESKNPLRSPDLLKAKSAWINAVNGGDRGEIFRAEAYQYHVSELSPIVAYLTYYDFKKARDFAKWMGDGRIKKDPDDPTKLVISPDLPQACTVIKHYFATRCFVKEPVFEPCMRIPYNLLRYVYEHRDHLTDGERQHAIELLSGWVMAQTRSTFRKDSAGENLDHELPTQTTLQLAELPPPPTLSFRLDSFEKHESLAAQAMLARGLLVFYMSFEVKEWCDNFALETARALCRDFYRSGNHLSHPDGQRILDGLEGYIDKKLPFTDEQDFSSYTPPKSYVLDPAAEFEARERMGQYCSEAKRALSLLSAREREVIILSQVEGLTQQQIANRLGISFESVNTYLDRVREKGRGERRPSPISRRKKIDKSA